MEKLAAIALTVPCCWDHEAEEIPITNVYKAVKDSRLLRPTHPLLSTRPIVVNEAEAVAETFLARNPEIRLDPCAIVIIVDAGGGTTDSISLQTIISDDNDCTVFVTDVDNVGGLGISVGSQSLSKGIEDSSSTRSL